MSKIMNKDNEWDQIADTVEGPTDSKERRDIGGFQALEDWKGS